MFDKLIQSWLTNFSSNGTDITLPIASLPELSAPEVDAVTGDVRKFTFALAEALYQKYNGLDSAGKPTKMVITKTSSPDNTAGTITHNYTFRFINTIVSQDVAPE